MPSRSRRRDDDEVEETTEEETPRRGRSRRRDDDEDDAPRRSRRRSRDEDDEDEPPRRRSRSRDEDEEDEPRRSRASRRSRDRDDDGGGRRGRAASGFGSYAQKRAKTSNYANEFKPADNTPTLFKILDEEPFDNYVQHWVDDAPKDDPKSYMCYDDEYHTDFAEKGCPLCEVGEPGKAYSLWNVLDLTNPNKPEVKVWVTSPMVTDILYRMSENSRTSPLNREDIYFEVEKIKKKKKTEWRIETVKARDLAEDFDIEPFEEDEIESFLEKRYEDRKGVVRVDSWDRLDDLAEYITSG